MKRTPKSPSASVNVRTIVVLALVFALGMTASAARKKDKKEAAPKIDTSKLAWPPAPMPPVLKYVGMYYGQSDFAEANNKKSGWLERMAGVVEDQHATNMMKPYSAAVDSKGLIYVTDTGAHLVFKFDLAKKQVTALGATAGTQMEMPTGIAIDEQDRVFVTESFLHRVTCFGPDGHHIATFGDKRIERAAGLAIDTALRRLYVADVNGHRVAVFDLDSFKFLRYIGKASDDVVGKDGTFFGPTNIAVDPDGLVYVVDTLLNRVQVFDSEGEFVRSIGTPGVGAGGFQRAKGIAIDGDGNIYISDSSASLIQMFDSRGGPLMPIGRSGSLPGQFMVPAGLTFDKFNRLIVVEQQIPRIQVFRYIPELERPKSDAPKEAAAQAASR